MVLCRGVKKIVTSQLHLAATADLQLLGTILSKLQFDDDEDAMHSYTTTTTTAPETQPSNGEMAESSLQNAWPGH